MINPDKQYRTRDGREVRIYAVDGHGRMSVHGAVFEGGGWRSVSWRSDGSRVHFDAPIDLIEVKPRHKRTVWLNVYQSNLVAAHSTSELADGGAKYTKDTRIACLKLELDFEEGEGLDNG